MFRSILTMVLVIAALAAFSGVYVAKHVPRSQAHEEVGASLPATMVAAAPSAGSGRVVIGADALGHFAAGVEIEGLVLPMLVDTGASFVALRDEDANALGLHPLPADYTLRTQTANGAQMVAPVHLSQVRIGSIYLRDVDALVAPAGALPHSLLGMSFLKRLSGFEVANGQLVLHQ